MMNLLNRTKINIFRSPCPTHCSPAHVNVSYTDAPAHTGPKHSDNFINIFNGLIDAVYVAI